MSKEPWDRGSLWCLLSLGKPSETFSGLAHSLFLEMSSVVGLRGFHGLARESQVANKTGKVCIRNDVVTHAEDHGPRR